MLNGEFAKQAALFRGRWTEARAFKIQQESLGRKAPAKSGKAAVGSDDAVAGNDDCNWIVVVRLADSPRRQW